MAFDLTIGTEPVEALEASIMEELEKRGFTPEPDKVMAEFITIMLVNNKTAEQINAELEELIGASEYDPDFTVWLFEEAARKSQPVSEPAAPPAAPSKPEGRTSSPESARRTPTGPRTGATPLYNHALSQALPSGPSAGQKRPASARSPSPVGGHANKNRKLDLPTGPRAMHSREGNQQRTLLDRMGGRAQGGPRYGRDEIQARIEAVTLQGAMNGMNGGFNNGMGGMMMPGNDMAAAAAAAGMGGGMMNPMAFQEIMMNQMALMAQMASSISLLNNNQGQSNGPNGFPNTPLPDGQQQNQQQFQHRRGGPPAGRGGGHGQLKAQWVAPRLTDASKSQNQASPSPAPAIQAPTPQQATASVEAASSGLKQFTPPERPQSPSLCKFGLKCTNALCRYSHASPVATPESGVVLSNDPCEAGIECNDKDCIKAHVSPAAKGVTSVPIKPKPKVEAAAPSPPKPPCRYGANCTKVASGQCPFSHPFIPKSTSSHAATTQCRFGAGCTRATCPFQHPPGRVLPGTFHRGLAENAPTVTVPTPETGSIGGPSPHRSVVFNKSATTATDKEQSEQKESEGAGATVEAAA
ncbi:uncharacterized protein FOMMEDRAFT_138089 [Fomitiporia mediterranea MF3/22]|uniref:uncharacterized protein n=1 Tax=Fomitiporia mediterranea (strain MF3/22) TaxID=694068 RepID=UPI0004408CAA|nr:uncharacterized protein FOMMEDRAFT_138089 [Fomitiporia mediterranea MF3/22]EJD08063.1 hypothetical protein FOMMEDRAFT_138089 [Fomitiporia mediterranea MF3/22]